jgi:coenzyme A diphosphatase NUDT7
MKLNSWWLLVNSPEFPSHKTAAVLVLLFMRDGHLRVLLTTRSKHLRSHPGEVALPGGKTDPTDGSPVATAVSLT